MAYGVLAARVWEKVAGATASGSGGPRIVID
jgi:hypothetical protein